MKWLKWCLLYCKCLKCVRYFYFILFLLLSSYQHTLHMLTLGCCQLSFLLKQTKEHLQAPNTIPFSFSPVMTDKQCVLLLSQPFHFFARFHPLSYARILFKLLSCLLHQFLSLYWIILLRKQP